MSSKKLIFVLFCFIRVYSTNTSLDQLATALHHQNEELTYILESLISDIQHNTFFTKNNTLTLEQLKILHTNLASISEHTTDISTLTHNIDTITHTINSLELGIQNNFTNWYNPISRAQSTQPKTISEIEKQTHETTKKLALVQLQLPILGLNYSQRFYRTICNKLSHKHITIENTQKLLTAAVLSSFIYFIYRLSGRDSTGTIRHPKWLFPISVLLVEQVFKNDITRAYIWCAQHIKNIHNNLQGNQAVTDLIKTVPTTGFESVYGNNHNKLAAQKRITYFNNYEQRAQKNTLTQHTLLLIGNQHTGKTFFAQQICGELNKQRTMLNLPRCPLINVNSSTINNLQGWDPGLKGFFDYARDQAPCVLFINEIDQLINQDKKVFSEFLAGLNTLAYDAAAKPVLVITATADPEQLDLTLFHKNKFATKIFFDYPSVQERTEFLRNKLQEFSLAITQQQLTELAQAVGICSYNDLDNLMLHIQQEIITGKKPISIALIEDVLNTRIRKIKLPDKCVSAETNHIAAIHHASHIVSLNKLSPETIITYATLAPVEISTSYTTQLGAVFTCNPNEHSNLLNSKDKKCMSLLAGHIGEELFFGTCAYVYTNEAQNALELCMQIEFKGIAFKKLPKKTQGEFVRQALDLKIQFEQEVRKILAPEKNLIMRIAQELENKISLTQAEIAGLIRQ